MNYARVVNGVVVELGALIATPAECFPPAMAADWEAIPAGVTPAQGWTVNGTVWAAPVPPAPTPAQQAAAMLATGLAVTSTGTPALNGTYAVNAQAQNNILAVQVYVQANGKFPGSSGTYPWLDAAGTAHVFPSIAEFTAFATAVADFVADLSMIMLTGDGTLPSARATIP